MEATLQGIFKAQFEHFAKAKKLPYNAYKAAQAIQQCRTVNMGGHVQRCPEGHITRVQYNSCKHRSCPRCAELPKARWAEAQQHRLLACDHYHVIFTLAHELLPLWQYNRAWFINTLFQVCRDTLMTLLKDERYLGATPGILMSLHTWGRTLTLHPHIHCLVTGGGLSEKQAWKASRHDYLIPVAVVKALYKGKLLSRLWDALKTGNLTLPNGWTRAKTERTLKAINRKSWNVRLQERYQHGRGVMRYLSRYVKGGPISDKRVQSANADEVTFRYKDHRDGKTQRMSLSTDHFIERVLWHVPEQGQHTIRHYGLYAHRSRDKRALCRTALGQEPETDTPIELDWQTYLESIGINDKAQCPTCGKRMVSAQHFHAKRRGHTNSIERRPLRVFIQQDVQATLQVSCHPLYSASVHSPPDLFLPVDRSLN